MFEDAISKTLVGGVLVEGGDVALFDLQQPNVDTNDDDKEEEEDFLVVTVSREREDDIFQVEIEESTRNMVALVPESDDASENDSDKPPADDVNGLAGTDPKYLLASD